MATYCFPFDNASETELDRCVGSDVFAEYLRFMVGIDHGVYNKAGRSYQVRAAGSGYAVDVEGGIAFILGRGRFDDAQTTVSLEASEGLSRIDRIVLRLNKPDRYIYLTAIKGISASDPIPPELIRNDDIYDICLAEVRIDPVYSDILPENIIDTRFDTALCGYMPQFGKVNTDGMFDQIQAAYDRYMELLHDGIEDSVAGNLQTQIDDAAVHSGILYTTSTNHALTAAVSENSCTLRFVADAAYVKGNTLTVNGDGYTLMMPNGKALPDNAWVKGAVVCLQLDPETKTAFFNGGGADLSFVTASAEQILAGYVGADSNGEPLVGVAKLGGLTAVDRSSWSASIQSKEMRVEIPFATDANVCVVYGTAFFYYNNSNPSGSATTLYYDVIVENGTVVQERYRGGNSSADISASFNSATGVLSIIHAQTSSMYTGSKPTINNGYAYYVGG